MKHRVTLDIPQEWIPILDREADQMYRNRSQHLLSLIDPSRRQLPAEITSPAQPARCTDPITRRIGTGCGQCGKENVK